MIPEIVGRILGRLIYSGISGFVNSTFWLASRLKLRVAKEWPVTEARIELRRIERGYKGKTFACRLGYSYTVAGEYYAGYAEKEFKSVALATAFLVQVKDRQRVPIRYKPSKPGTSVLDLEAFQLTAGVPRPTARKTSAFQSSQQQTAGSLADVSSEDRVMGEMSTLPSFDANSSNVRVANETTQSYSSTLLDSGKH